MKLFLSFIALILTACGGGGGGSDSVPTQSISSVAQSSSLAASSSSVAPSSSSISSTSTSSSSSSSSSASSISSQSSSSVQINPLSVGAGTVSTRFVVGGTYKINEETGALSPVEDSLPDNYRAADTDSSGYVIAVHATLARVDELDLEAGTARHLFDTPEEMDSIAVSSTGEIVMASSEEYFSKKYIYRFDRTGNQLGKIVSDDINPTGMDFDKDGNLICLDLFGTWKVNPSTGQGEQLFSILNGPYGQNDIDIDSENNLRVIIGDDLDIYNLATGVRSKTLVLQSDYFAFSPLVRR